MTTILDRVRAHVRASGAAPGAAISSPAGVPPAPQMASAPGARGAEKPGTFSRVADAVRPPLSLALDPRDPRVYVVAQLDGPVVAVTLDSEEATRVMCAEPTRRCVLRAGAVLRWGAAVPSGEKHTAERFLRAAGLISQTPAANAQAMRDRLREAGHPNQRVHAEATRAAVQAHRAALPQTTETTAAPMPPEKGTTMNKKCQQEGCDAPVPVVRIDTKPHVAGYCRRHRKLVLDRERDAGKRAAKPAARPAPAKPTPKPAAKTPRTPPGVDLFAHARDCMLLVDQLGGIDRARRIAEAMAG